MSSIRQYNHSNQPVWYRKLINAIEFLLEGICSLYPDDQRKFVIMNLTREIHKRASDLDPEGAWLTLIMDISQIETSILRQALPEFPVKPHPSLYDAIDVIEDISHIQKQILPSNKILRICVMVIWTKFIPQLSDDEQRMLAVEAVSLA